MDTVPTGVGSMRGAILLFLDIIAPFSVMLLLHPDCGMGCKTRRHLLSLRVRRLQSSVGKSLLPCGAPIRRQW